MKIAFFCIYAHGHTNPTLEVVRELTRRGHEVWYYSFEEFRARIEAAGARFIACDGFLPPAPKNLEKKVGRDFASLIEMAADTTVALEPLVTEELGAWKPDVIVSDSVCLWGKLFAWKLGVPMVCSTTTFAFNQQSAATMKRGPGEMLRALLGMPRINAKMKLLRARGYPVKSFLDLIQNDNETDTVVYTSRAFQPMADTFSERYCFVGPSLAPERPAEETFARPLVYVSLGTVLNRNAGFYRNCLEALRGMNAVLSVGENTDIAALGKIPEGIIVRPRVDQLAVLRQADAFITHCGMNSVSESIACGVPMVLFPQHSEEGAVANRAAELQTGVLLRDTAPQTIRAAVESVLQNSALRENARALAATFREAGGAPRAADKIESAARKSA